MEPGYKINYYNDYFAGKDNDYNYLKVRNLEDKNEIHLVWWDEDKPQHFNTIGQWKMKIK